MKLIYLGPSIRTLEPWYCAFRFYLVGSLNFVSEIEF